MENGNQLEQEIKDKVLKEGCEKFVNSPDFKAESPAKARQAIESLLATASNKEENKSLETDLLDEIERCKSRTFDAVIKDHKELISEGGLVTGFKSIDDHLVFQKTDFIVIQGMSNHGKSSFMANLGYRFLTNKENKKQKPLCIHIAYEAHMLRTEEKFINIISYDLQKELAIKFDRTSPTELLSEVRRQGNYLYLSDSKTKKARDLYDDLIKNDRLMIMKKQQLESLPLLIDMLKERHKDRTIVLFLDYLQILPALSRSEGWEKMKEIAYWLENLAIEKEIIIFTGSQVNEKRDTREGKDIYNACTINLDVLNNSHELLKNHSEHGHLHEDKIDGKNVVTLTCRKQKFGATFCAEKAFLFNGFVFEEKPELKSVY